MCVGAGHKHRKIHGLWSRSDLALHPGSVLNQVYNLGPDAGPQFPQL